MLTKLFLGQNKLDITAAVKQMVKDMLIVLLANSCIVTILLESMFEKWSDSSVAQNPWPLAVFFGVVVFLIGSWVTVYLESKFQKIYRESEERVKKSKVPLSITWK